MKKQPGWNLWDATAFIAAVSFATSCTTPNEPANNVATNNVVTTNGATTNGATTNGATTNGGTTNGATTNGATNNGSAGNVVDIGALSLETLLAEAEAALARRVEGMPCGAVNNLGNERIEYGYDEQGRLSTTHLVNYEPFPAGLFVLRVHPSDTVTSSFTFTPGPAGGLWLDEFVELELGRDGRIVSEKTYQASCGAERCVDVNLSRAYAWDYSTDFGYAPNSRWTIRPAEERLRSIRDVEVVWSSEENQLSVAFTGGTFRFGFDSEPSQLDISRLWMGPFPFHNFGHSPYLEALWWGDVNVGLDNIFELDARLTSTEGSSQLSAGSGLEFGPTTFSYEGGALRTMTWDEVTSRPMAPGTTVTRTTTFLYDCPAVNP